MSWPLPLLHRLRSLVQTPFGLGALLATLALPIVVMAAGAPSLSLTVTGTGTYQSGNTVYVKTNPSGSMTITANASDPDSVASVKFNTLSASTAWTANPTLANTDTTASYEQGLTWATTAVSTTMVVTATDTTATAGSVTLTITKDVTAPSGTFTAYVSGTTYSSSQDATVTWTETDAGSGTASRSVQRQIATISSPGNCGTFTDDGSPYTGSLSWAQTGLTDARCYRWVLTLTDNLGNSVTRTSGELLIDTTPPTAVEAINFAGSMEVDGLVIWYRANGAYSANVEAIVTDAESGAGAVRFTPAAPAGWTTTSAIDTTSPYTNFTTWAGATTDVWTLTLEGRNKAGLYGDPVDYTYTPDTADPVATIGAPVVARPGSTTLTYSWTLSDSQSGISGASSQFYRATPVSGSCSGATWSTYGAVNTNVATLTRTLSPAASNYCYKIRITVTDNVNRSASYDSTEILIDDAAPTVSSFSSATTTAASSSSIAYSLVFNEPVTGLAAGDFSNQGTATGCSFAVSGSGASYTVTVSGCSASGTVTPRLAATSVTDLSANNGPATYADATTTVTLDSSAPTVTTFATDESSPTKATSISYTLTFSEAVTFGIAPGAFGVQIDPIDNAGTATGCVFEVSGSGTSYTVSVTGCGSSGTLTPRLAGSQVYDAATNTVSSNPTGTTLTLDRIAPSVSSFSSAAASPTSSASIAFSLSFGESVTGLGAGDFTNEGTATGCSFGVSGSGSSYTVTATNCGSGTLSPRLTMDAVVDTAGNSGPSLASDATTFISVDHGNPAVTSFSGAVSAGTPSWSLAFSETVTGLSLGDFTAGGTATGWTYQLTGSGASYTITASGGTPGTITLTLSAFTVLDAAGNSGPATSAGAAQLTVGVSGGGGSNDQRSSSVSVDATTYVISSDDFHFGAGTPGDRVSALGDVTVTGNNAGGYVLSLSLTSLDKANARAAEASISPSLIALNDCVEVVRAATSAGVAQEATGACHNNYFNQSRDIATSGLRTLEIGDRFGVTLAFTIPWVEDGDYAGTATWVVSGL